MPSPPHPGVVALAAGYDHTCALLSGGGVDCWGYNGDGEPGFDDTTDRLTPTGVTGLGAGWMYGEVFSYIVDLMMYNATCNFDIKVYRSCFSVHLRKVNNGHVDYFSSQYVDTL